MLLTVVLGYVTHIAENYRWGSIQQFFSLVTYYVAEFILVDVYGFLFSESGTLGAETYEFLNRDHNKKFWKDNIALMSAWFGQILNYSSSLVDRTYHSSVDYESYNDPTLQINVRHMVLSFLFMTSLPTFALWSKHYNIKRNRISWLYFPTSLLEEKSHFFH